MDLPRRELVLPALVAAGLALLLGTLGMLTPAFTDYELEAEPSLQALRSGDWVSFLELAPAYGGSLVLRAPFALLPELWGGGDLALFRSMAVPCLVAAALLGVVLWRRARMLGRPGMTCWIALALVAGNPLTLRTLEIGHPEELLGAVFCIGSALAASRDRALLAGVLMGLAVANKPWAVLAVLPVVAILRTRLPLFLLATAAVTGLVMLPLALTGGAVEEASLVARKSGQIFQPWQVWWFLGDAGHLVIAANSGEKPGFRVPPEWFTLVSHPILVLAPAAICLALLPRVRRRHWHDGLLLLAFALLLRCVLDPWNISYYSIPFLFALVTWEVHARSRPPLVSLAVTVLSWFTLVWLTTRVHPDAQAAAYQIWAVPLAGLMAMRLLGLPRGRALGRLAPSRRRAAPAEAEALA